MKFVATIRAVGQINRPGNWKSSAASFSGPRSSSGGGGGLRQIYAAARDDRPNNSLPSAIVASTILASAILYQENNRTKYYTADAECSALPTQPSGVAAVDNITSFAKPVEDIKSVYKLGDIIGEVSQTHMQIYRLAFIIDLILNVMIYRYVYSDRAALAKCTMQHVSRTANQWLSSVSPKNGRSMKSLSVRLVCCKS